MKNPVDLMHVICIAMLWVTGLGVHVPGKSTLMFALNHGFSREPGNLEPSVMSLPYLTPLSWFMIRGHRNWPVGRPHHGEAEAIAKPPGVHHLSFVW